MSTPAADDAVPVLQALAEEVGLEYVDLRETDVDLAALEGFPQKLIYRQSLFPIGFQGDSIVVATSDPLDLYPLDEASAATGKNIIPVVAERAEIARLMNRHLGVGSETVEGLMAAKSEEEVELLEKIETDGSELSEMAQEASVVRLVNEILLEAIQSRASDVHLETQSNGLVIRYRIDGILHPQPTPPEINRFQAAIISRLKIMGRLNIAEKRLPQDGRIKLRVHGREVDIRLSVIPMIHGEGMVMRLLDKGRMAFNLKSVGMLPDTDASFRKLIDRPEIAEAVLISTCNRVELVVTTANPDAVQHVLLEFFARELAGGTLPTRASPRISLTSSLNGQRTRRSIDKLQLQSLAPRHRRNEIETGNNDQVTHRNSLSFRTCNADRMTENRGVYNPLHLLHTEWAELVFNKNVEFVHAR